ncbi:hypothetical protein, partial [Ralstonia mannitolilytica]|uniref:hypothetical protein n=1 Tax=Ralstonia mannitolilytica TaxID=105219 RepID=UPI00293164E4
RLAGANPWIGTTICTGNSPKADHELRLKPDHPMGSGHWVHRHYARLKLRYFLYSCLIYCAEILPHKFLINILTFKNL